MHVPTLFALFAVLTLFRLAPAAAHEFVQGKIIDARSGQPLAGAIVSNGSEEVRTGNDGVFMLEAVDSLVRVRAPGYQRFTAPAVDGAQIALEEFTPRALYLSFYGVGEPILRDPALDLVEQSEVNALVIDVKGDRGMMPFRCAVPLAKEIGAQRVRTVRDPAALMANLKARGIYTIARIVTFKDNRLAEARPEWALKDANGEIWRDGEGLAWVDPFEPEVWDYNIAIAREAARLGFDEVQFDYVRFPSQQGPRYAFESTEESRVHAISSFLWNVRDRLRPYNVFISADVFGYVCWNLDDTRIGQRLEDIAKHVDYISPMLYPSGFNHGIDAYRDPVKHPYQIVYLSLERARRRTGMSSRRFRPWLQAFRDYAFDRRPFGSEAVAAQTAASDQFGTNGWMLWNARNVYRNLGLEILPFEEEVKEAALVVERQSTGTGG